MLYRVKYTTTAEGNVIAELPDFPGVFSVGKDEKEALAMVKDALLTVCAQYIQDKEPVPIRKVRIKRGQPAVELSTMPTAKVAIHNAMLMQGVSQVALATQLGTDPKAIRRLLDLDHNSHWLQIEAALAILGFTIHSEIAAVDAVA